MASLAFVLVASSVAHAEDARIVAARAAYEQLEQPRVIEILEPALAGPLDNHDRAVALRLVGCAHWVLRQRDAAIEAFRKSFAIEPDAALDPQLASSPDARSLFEVARGEWNAALVVAMEAFAPEIAKLKLRVRTPTNPQGGAPILMGVDVEDPGHLVSRIELSYRKRGRSEFTLLSNQPAAALELAIPSDETESARPFVLEYHVTLRHQTGFALLHEGDADHPDVLAVAAGHRPRWHESWWVRGVIGLGVVALGAGGYLFYRSIDVGPQMIVVKGT